jgi:arginase
MVARPPRSHLGHDFPVTCWELIRVPYTSAARPGGIASAIGVLRSAGLAERLGNLGVTDGGDMQTEPASGERGPSGLLNERALGRLVVATRERVRETRARERLPLLVGGDCPAVFLGALAAIAPEEQRSGLVMIDGHEDAWPPALSETGEASDSELGIALGLVGDQLPPPLDESPPLVDPGHVALLGPRDATEIAEAGASSVRADVAYFLDDCGVAAIGGAPAMRAALEAIGDVAFWVHVDLDVLASEDFAAVDYPQSGGLRWNELDELVEVAFASPRCRGASVVITTPTSTPTAPALRRSSTSSRARSRRFPRDPHSEWTAPAKPV